MSCPSHLVTYESNSTSESPDVLNAQSERHPNGLLLRVEVGEAVGRATRGRARLSAAIFALGAGCGGRGSGPIAATDDASIWPSTPSLPVEEDLPEAGTPRIPWDADSSDTDALTPEADVDATTDDASSDQASGPDAPVSHACGDRIRDPVLEECDHGPGSSSCVADCRVQEVAVVSLSSLELDAAAGSVRVTLGKACPVRDGDGESAVYPRSRHAPRSGTGKGAR